MRIDKSFNIQKGMRSYESNLKNKAKSESSKSSETDKLELSSKAKDFKVAMASLKDVNDIRDEKVNKLKKQIEAGNYKISSTEIAEKMVSDSNMYKKI